MKRNMIIVTALAVAGTATYFIRKNLLSGSPEKMNEQVRSHHLTNAFSKAKQHAVSAE